MEDALAAKWREDDALLRNLAEHERPAVLPRLAVAAVAVEVSLGTVASAAVASAAVAIAIAIDVGIAVSVAVAVAVAADAVPGGGGPALKPIGHSMGAMAAALVTGAGAVMKATSSTCALVPLR